MTSHDYIEDNLLITDPDEDLEKVNTFEGFLYKTSQKKTKKYWFKLINKDLYCKIII